MIEANASRAGQVDRIRNILVATDGSRGGERAVDVAATLAKATGAKLLIATVQENLPAEQARQLARAERDVGDAIEALSAQILRSAIDRANRAGISDVHAQTAWGDPAGVLIDLAKRQAADAIVVGRRGHGQLAGLLLGSVSQKLVSLAPCTVIVVP